MNPPYYPAKPPWPSIQAIRRPARLHSFPLDSLISPESISLSNPYPPSLPLLPDRSPASSSSAATLLPPGLARSLPPPARASPVQYANRLRALLNGRTGGTKLGF